MNKEALNESIVRNSRAVTMEEVKETVRTLSPTDFNNMEFDEEAGLLRADYCYADLHTLEAEYEPMKAKFVATDELQTAINTLLQEGTGDYVRMADDSLVHLIKKSPKTSLFPVVESANKGLFNKGYAIDNRQIVLDVEGTTPTNDQPLYAVKELCSNETCDECNGTKMVSKTDKKTGEVTQEECPKCKGHGTIGHFGYIVTTLHNHQTQLVIVPKNAIDHLSDSAIKDHKGDDREPSRMFTHFNGTNLEEYPAMLQDFYLDAIKKQLEENTLTVDAYIKMVPCVGFRYKEVVSGKECSGCIVDIFDNPELKLRLASGTSKFFGSMKNGMKSISGFFGAISSSESHKNRKDTIRATRLLIGIALADGEMSPEERELVMSSITGVDELTNGDRKDLSALLSSPDSSFLTDDDFEFNNEGTARVVLDRLEKIAQATDEICEAEQSIIDRLRASLERIKNEK